MAEYIPNPLAALSTITANGTSAVFLKPLRPDRKEPKVAFVYNLGTAPTGTSPTIQFTVQCSYDGVLWFNAGQTAVLTAVGSGRLEFAAIEPYWQVVTTVGGTTPSFTNVTSFLGFLA